MAILSVAVYPFSIKVLWACIPDSIWLPALGQRRTWIIFAQSVIGALLIALGFVFDDLAKDKNIVALTCILFVVIFFVTVQDIAVDGWCVTLLSDELQVSFAFRLLTCNLASWRHMPNSRPNTWRYVLQSLSESS